MVRHKCSNCGTTKTKTFWTYENHTMLCDKCHKYKGDSWQKKLEHDRKISLINKVVNCLIVIIIGICVLYGIYYFFLGGYGLSGYNLQGYDREGYNALGYNRQGFDAEGYNAKGFDTQGYDKQGFDTQGYDSLGFNAQGYNKQGYDSNGYNRLGYDIKGYDREGYNSQGFDRLGHSILGWCGDGICNNEEICNTCPQDCGQCVQQETKEYSFQVYDNAEPYYSTFCDKINPYDLSVREAVTEAIKNDPGSYSVAQLFDIYDWVVDNIIYQNVPLSGIPYPARETLVTKSGDCKNQAVLIASMIAAIGGTTKVVLDPSCQHAYTIVLFGKADGKLTGFSQTVAEHYGANVQVRYFSDDKGIWVIFDPAGGKYPGNTLPQCSGNRLVYYVTSCLSCLNQYPTMQYTYGDKCYSECPSGTISTNNYACSSCPEGYWSHNNQCVTCPKGYVLYTDGRCYVE
ncbi:MAG: transglutaminase domain-containing protein [Candidatus Woesearchaeota archaeon]